MRLSPDGKWGKFRDGGKLHLKAFPLKQLKDDHARVRRSNSIENTQSVQDRGHSGVVARIHVQLFHLMTKQYTHDLENKI